MFSAQLLYAPYPLSFSRNERAKAAHPRPEPKPLLTRTRAEAPGEKKPRSAAPAFDPLGKRFARGRIMSGSTQRRIVLFSFDDGPDCFYTPKLLKRLDERGVRALFFLTGRRVEGKCPSGRARADIVREIAAHGHLIGNHTYDHLELSALGSADLLDQVLRAEKAIEGALGARPWLIRPPGGGHSERVDRLLQERGYTIVLWNLGSGDFQVRSPQDVLQTWQRVFERRHREEGERGGIVLMHDTYEWSIEAFSLIVDQLQARNCELLARGEELFDIVDDPRYFFQRQAGFETPEQEVRRHRGLIRRLEERQARLRLETARRCQGLAAPAPSPSEKRVSAEWPEDAKLASRPAQPGPPGSTLPHRDSYR